jgi:hypothetical protein
VEKVGQAKEKRMYGNDSMTLPLHILNDEQNLEAMIVAYEMRHRGSLQIMAQLREWRASSGIRFEIRCLQDPGETRSGFKNHETIESSHPNWQYSDETRLKSWMTQFFKSVISSAGHDSGQSWSFNNSSQALPGEKLCTQ